MRKLTVKPIKSQNNTVYLVAIVICLAAVAALVFRLSESIRDNYHAARFLSDSSLVLIRYSPVSPNAKPAWLARTALVQGNPVDAQKIMIAAIGQEDSLTLSLQGDIYYELGDVETAVLKWREAENLVQLKNVIAKETALGNFQNTLLVYDAVLSLYPEEEAQPFSKHLWYEMGKQEEAKTVLLDSIENYPDSKHLLSWYRQLGTFARVSNDLDEADLYFERILALNPEDGTAYVDLAWLKFSQGMALQEYAHLLDKALALNPNLVEAYYLWAVSLNRDGKYDEANSYFDTANQLKPDQPEWLLLQANNLRDGNEFAAAIEIYDEIVEQHPQAHEAYYERAWTFHSLDQPEFAAVDIEKAIELNPTPGSRYNLRAATIYEKANLLDIAERYYQRVLDLEENNAEAQAGLSRLQKD